MNHCVTSRFFCLRSRISILLLLAITAPSPVLAIEWEDQSVFRINKEAPHATKMPFADAESALSKERLQSSYAQLLNGEWKFHWSPRPESRPTDFYQTDFDDSAWDTIPVPANVELEGHGIPIYANSEYPFKRDAPRVMGEPKKHWTAYENRNPVSSYRKAFTVPESWQDRETFIVFNGVQSAFYLWCNGQKVGYSQDSRTPAEFNLTPYLHEGENTLAVEVYRFSDGSYLEDQDFWRLSGIFRDVYLWSAASIDLRDFEIQASLDDAYEKGTLSVKTWTKAYAKLIRSYKVDVQLLDDGKVLSQLTLAGKTQAEGDDIAEITTGNLEIEPWSAEKPRLYDLLLTLTDSDGEAVACYSRKVGFRTSEIKNGQLLVNGQPILIKGVNRHDHHHITGHYISEDAMREDLDQMKRLNVNAIRTSHYPNDPRFLELCDEYGFYVVSEANIETHGYGRSGNPLPKDMSWYEAHLDRMRNNIEMHKNHACAIIWSMGNEAGDGPIFAKCLEWIHDRDSSRPVQYENALVSDYRPRTPVDIFAPMYYRIHSIPGYVEREMEKAPEDRRPLIQCEYNHAMGNSSGGLKEYWDLVRALPLYQGGFIWDWRDQGLLRYKKSEDGGDSTPYFAYGGDYGDHPNSNNFCMNGVVAADTSLNPHAHEVYHQYRNILTAPVDVTSAPNVTVRVTNEYFFTDLEGASYRWQLLKDGDAIAVGKGTLPSIAPQATADVTIDTGVTPDVACEYVLTIEHLQDEDRPWANADHVAACDQLLLPWGEHSITAHSTNASLELSEEGRVTVTGGRFQASVDPSTGQLVSYMVNGKELLEGPLRLNFWRPPNDNDRGNGMPHRLGVWRDAGDKVKVTAHQHQADASVVRLTYDLSVPAGDSTARVEYTIHGDGLIEVVMKLHPAGEKIPSLPRVGMQCQIAKSLDTWSWYGRGPWENYSDRNSGAYFGIHSGKVNELARPYSETQEYANRTGVRWTSFVGADGAGLRFESTDGQPLEVGAYPFAQADLDGESRSVDLAERDYLTVHIAHAQMGVGGEDSWGARTLRKYQLPANQEYAYAFRILPISAAIVQGSADEEGFRSLISPADFDGDSFSGWTQRGGKATYHVEGETIVGTSQLRTPNTFLSSNHRYGDFILEYEVKVDSPLNSGVQIRSECFDEETKVEVTGADGKSKTIRIPAGRVHGYQVEIDPSDRAWSGGIYDEARRGWLFNLKGDQFFDARAAFNRDGWNKYRIEAIGDRIRTWVNGVPVADLTDSMTVKGFIALQVHSIYDDENLVGKQVRWRNFRIKSLDSE